MKKIEQLLEHAHNNEEQKFKDTFNALRNSLNVWETNGGSPSEAIMLICGNLMDRYDDLLKVVGYYWKTALTADVLKSPSNESSKGVLKTLPNVIGCVQQNYGWEQVVEVAHVFLNSPDPSIPAETAETAQTAVKNILLHALGKLRNTNWSTPDPKIDETIEKIIQVGKFTTEGLVVMAVRHGNDELLSYIAQTKSLTQKEAAFVVIEWSEKLSELMTVIDSYPKPSTRKNAMRMFPIAAPFATVDQILNIARLDDGTINLGPLGECVKKVDAWDRTTQLPISDRWLQQMDLILENCETSATTPNEDFVDKLVVLSADKYPQAQHWRNRINRHKMLQEVGGGQLSNRKM